MITKWKIKIFQSFATALTNFSRRSDDTINRPLFNFFFNIAMKVPPQTREGVKVVDISIDPTRNLWFRLFSPIEQPTHSTLPLIVFFHGGGFSFGSPDGIDFDPICRRFTRETPAVVVSVNYRLAPEHRYPAQYEDGFEALKFLDEETFSDFPANADLTRCFLAGDSAGGNLAHHMACQAVQTKFQKLKVIGLIAIQPFFGGEERTESELQLVRTPLVSMERTDWHWKMFLPVGLNRDHHAVNVFGPNAADLSGLKHFPATLVFVGGFDPLQDWQRSYYQGLKRAGKQVRLIEYSNAFHGFYVFRKLPESILLLKEVIDFINNF